MSLAMSEHERQEFLAGVHVGVISIERADGAPLTVPIWYGYEPGGLAHRYFGPELGDAYVASSDEEGNLKFSMRPTHWWSVDHSKFGGQPSS